MDKIFDIYTDYLQVNSGQATATGLSKILDNKISHDQITYMLNHITYIPSIYNSIKTI